MSKLCRAMSEFTWYYVKWCTDATVGFAKDFKHRKGIISLCIFCIRYCCCKSDILLLHQFMNSCIFTRVYAVTFLEEYRQRFRSLCVPEFATNGTGIAPVVNLMWNIGVLAAGRAGSSPPPFFSVTWAACSKLAVMLDFLFMRILPRSPFSRLGLHFAP